ncbi:MAG: hypothetical protein F9K15_14070 [Zoogloea sp.]|nr:MAG: hypothetical protein F9K15_14070 [Zoogloea sp.]
MAELLAVGLACPRVDPPAIAPSTPRDLRGFAQSPLTIAVFGLMAGYQGCGMRGLVRGSHRVLHAKPAREAGQNGA